MRAVEPLLVGLRDGDAGGLYLRAGEPPYWRVEGKLIPNGDPLPKGPDFEAMVNELLAAARLPKLSGLRRSAETNFAFDAVDARFRVELFRSEEGVNVVIKRFPLEVPKPADLNLPEALRQQATQRSGLVFLCGPPGSGKSTTAASLVEAINQQQACLIMTIVPAIEYVFTPTRSVIHQIEVGVDTPSHVAGLRTAIGAGANVIVVGDPPDEESARLLLYAADRGALVIVSLNAHGPIGCLERYLEMLPKKGHALHRSCLAQNLRMVAYQVLMPSLTGRPVPAHEILVMNRAVHNHLRDGRTIELHAVLQGSGRGSGQRSLDDSLEELVLTGRVDREEALRRSRNRNGLEQKTAKLADPRSQPG